jgi:hypothetical protein
MFDFIFDNVFYLVIAAVFIGRLVLRFSAAGRRGEKKASPPLPSFFRMEEDGEEEDEPGTPAGEGSRVDYSQTRSSSDYLKELVLREAAREAARKIPVQSPVRPAPVKLSPALVSAFDEPQAKKTGSLPKKEGVPQETAVFSAGRRLSAVDHLPSLKRAVILAEILGPPKGM